MGALRWGGRFGCLEVTYEESKPGVAPEEGAGEEGLEVTYEESKRRLPRAAHGALRGLEVTYEESKRDGRVQPEPGDCLAWKLPIRNPSVARVETTSSGSSEVWKLPMRNPSPTTLSRVCRALWCLEATYEESKRVPEGYDGDLHRVWKLPMRNPSRNIPSGSAPIW